MIKLSLKYAVICGVFLTIIYHVSFYFGSNPLIDVSHLIFDLILFGLFIFFAEKEFKAYHTDGIFHFWQGMTIGFIIYVVATMIFAFFLFLFFEINPEAIKAYQEAALAFLETKSATYIAEFGDVAYQEQISGITAIKGYDLVLSSALKKLLAGFFITPVISIILRKQLK